jgi:hypothetical protein
VPTDAAVFMFYHVCDMSCACFWITKLLAKLGVEVAMQVLGLNLARLPAILCEIFCHFLSLA